MMIRHILVPIDFSDVSENAVLEAAKICSSTGATLTLLHAYLIPGYSGGMAYETFIPPLDEHIELINKQLEEYVAGFPEMANLNVQKIAIPGSVQDMIGAYAEDNNVDLVVTGTRGSSGFMGFLLGTHSERIEGEVQCPVIVLPEGSQLKKGMRLAIAHDYKSTISPDQRELIRFILSFYSATFDVVHVEDKNDTPEAEISVRENLKALNPTFHKVVHDDVEKGLNEFSEENNIGMLAIIYHDHGFLNRIFGRSTSRQLTYHSKIPLLVLK